MVNTWTADSINVVILKKQEAQEWELNETHSIRFC